MAVAISEGELKRPCPNCTDEEKRDYGCTEDGDERYWTKLKGDKDYIKRCPYSMVKREHIRIVQSASLLDSGILPDAGGWLDQASSFVKSVCIVSAAKAEARKDG